jgi:Putative auto-transporter adhesin, head GIN domain
MKTSLFSAGKLLLVWMVLGLVACDKKDRPPNPNPGGTGEIRNVGNFTKLVNKSAAIVYVTQGDYKPLKIEADSAIIPLIETFVKSDTLFIQFKKEPIIKATKVIKIFITVPKLFYARLDGVGGFIGQNKFNYNDPVVYEVRGAGGFKAEMNTTKFVGIIKGAGEMEIAGTAANKEITISGAGKFDGRNLISENAVIKVSGVGNAYVNAQKKLNVTITGVGSVYYKGEPQITKVITGIGTLVKLP